MRVREHHEELWRSLPAPVAPLEFDLRRRFLLSHVRPGMRALDVGCGEGQFAGELLRAGAQVIAADIAEEPLRRARARNAALDLRLLDPEAWELPDASFDLVWAGEVIGHIHDTARWFSEARRVLGSGGMLLLSTPAHGPLRLLALSASPPAFAVHFDPRGEDVRFYSRLSLARLLRDMGFEQLRVSARAGPPLARRVLLASAVRSRF
jgi:2-polyprenyl-3-methyl-5-hydroxy-6-metoxy-1,4-benzoquinol methylase